MSSPRLLHRLPGLTPRQREVLALIAAGRTNFEIAQALGISLEGAKYHVREILARLGVDSREEAASLWREERRPAARAARALGGLFGSSASKWLAASVAAGLAAGAAAVFAVAIFGGAGGGRPLDAAHTATPAAPATATATPVATPAPPSPTTNRPAWAYDLATATGVPAVDAFLAAYRANDTAAILRQADPVEAPCVADPRPGVLVAPTCPEGAAEGTPVPAFLVSNCPDRWQPIDASITFRFETITTLGMDHLYAIARDTAAGLSYAVIYTSGEKFATFGLTDRGIAGTGGVCASEEMAAYVAGTAAWLLPPKAAPPLP